MQFLGHVGNDFPFYHVFALLLVMLCRDWTVSTSRLSRAIYIDARLYPYFYFLFTVVFFVLFFRHQLADMSDKTPDILPICHMLFSISGFILHQYGQSSLSSYRKVPLQHTYSIYTCMCTESHQPPAFVQLETCVFFDLASPNCNSTQILHVKYV